MRLTPQLEQPQDPQSPEQEQEEQEQGAIASVDQGFFESIVCSGWLGLSLVLRIGNFHGEGWTKAT